MITKETLKFCKKCLMLNTRPRLSFDEHGVCSACQWAEEKKDVVDWTARQNELDQLVKRYIKRSKNKFDIIVPSSGGKDSSYVLYQIKEKLGLHALVVTVQPPLPHEIGAKNLEESIKMGGVDHIGITPNYEAGRIIARKYFIEKGQPLYAWMIPVQTAIFKIAVLFDIPFVMFGEEGETEYGGSKKLKNKATYSLEESIELYLSGNDPKELCKDNNITEQELYWWTYPTVEEFTKLNPAIAHWSYFENWDPYRNYQVAKEKMGLSENYERSVGTYTNFAQNDTKLYDLHVYLMFLKFGFGRCCQDVCIDIRRGAITRDQGINLMKMYDGEYPEAYIDEYLDYLKMTKEEFDSVIDKWANKDLLKKENGRWVRDFEII